MNFNQRREFRIHPAVSALLLIAGIVTFVAVTSGLFTGAFRTWVPVSLVADRSGLSMESGAKVKLRGVVVGRVSGIDGDTGNAQLRLALDPQLISRIPANIDVRIEASTAFGAKYVNLIPPQHPSDQHISAGAVLHSSNVAVEVNTVFQSLMSVLHRVQPDKLNATLTALSEGLRGQGPRIAEAITSADQVLATLNPRMPAVAEDMRSLKGFADTYAAAAPDLLATLSSATTISNTLTTHATQLDALLLNVIGLSSSAVAVLAPHQNNLITAVNNLAPTTNLLLTYNPSLACTINGAAWVLPSAMESAGGNGKSLIVDVALLLGDDIYRYPRNLPKVNAHGGPGGHPSCGSLPIADNNFPVKYLVADTGYGPNPGDIRTNPGVGHPWWVNFFPSTRAVPGSPTLSDYGPPAPGPAPPP